MTRLTSFARSTAVLAGTLALAVPAAASAAPTTLPAASPVTVNVPIRVVSAPLSNSLNGLVSIRVGNSKPITVLLDTGSVGLRLFENAWKQPPAGVVVTKKPTSLTVRGVTFSGDTGSGVVEIAGVRTTEPVTFQVVTGSNPYITQAVKQGYQGILGIGLSRQDLPNPLSVLPGNVGRHWSVAFHANAKRTGGVGELILGALPVANADANVSLPFQGTGTYDQPLWNDQSATMCWSIGVATKTCTATYFDSVLPYVLAKGSVFAKLPADSKGYLKQGRGVSVRAQGAAFSYWNFTSGRTLSSDVVKVSPNGRGLVNMGNAAYFDYTVTYDLIRGMVSFS